jgi:hypothetical protein
MRRTGCGKTYTISWLCHELIRLRSQQGEKYFDSIIVVTDRTVLDAQLQDAIQQIDHQMEVLQLFLDNLRHFPAEIDVVDIGKQQIHCRARCLLFAVGMVDEDLIEMIIDLAKPAIAGFRFKTQHWLRSPLPAPRSPHPCRGMGRSHEQPMLLPQLWQR